MSFAETIISTWHDCFKQHIIFEYEKDKNIIVDNIHQKNSLIISNCQHTNFTVTKKINHILIEHCDNISININNGTISGLDIIHSSDITTNININPVYFVSFSSSFDINNNIDSFVALNTIFSSLNSSNLFYKLPHINKTFSPLLPLFNNYTLMCFSKDNGFKLLQT